MPRAKKTNLNKLSNTQVDGLKGHLIEVRRIGAMPIYVKVGRRDSIKNVLKNADIPSDNDIKVEGVRNGNTNWEEVDLRAKAIQFSKIAVTTKVNGA